MVLSFASISDDRSQMHLFGQDSMIFVKLFLDSLTCDEPEATYCPTQVDKQLGRVHFWTFGPSGP